METLPADVLFTIMELMPESIKFIFGQTCRRLRAVYVSRYPAPSRRFHQMLRFIPVYGDLGFHRDAKNLRCNQVLFITRFFINFHQLPRVAIPVEVREDIQIISAGRLPDRPLRLEHVAMVVEFNSASLLRQLVATNPDTVWKYPERISLSQAKIFLGEIRVEEIPAWALDYPSLIPVMRQHWPEEFAPELPKGVTVSLNYLTALARAKWSPRMAERYLKTRAERAIYARNYPNPEEVAHIYRPSRIVGLSPPSRDSRVPPGSLIVDSWYNKIRQNEPFGS